MEITLSLWMEKMTDEMMEFFHLNKKNFGDRINLIYLYSDKSYPIVVIESIRDGESYISLIFDVKTYHGLIEKANVISRRSKYGMPSTYLFVVRIFGIEFNWDKMERIDSLSYYKMITIPMTILEGILKFLEIKLPDSFLYDSTW